MPYLFIIKTKITILTTSFSIAAFSASICSMVAHLTVPLLKNQAQVMYMETQQQGGLSVLVMVSSKPGNFDSDHTNVLKDPLNRYK